MSIHIILGKPGSGKSLYAVNRLLTELRETERNIVTNLPLRLEALNEYVQKRWPEYDLRPMQRIRMMSEEELRQFWLVRGEFGPKGDTGVAYYLDEAHIAFNAREWASLGKGALHYLSQHRKLGDVVWVITQAPGNLDKQFRSVAEDFTVLRNEYLAQYGFFRGRGRFVRRSYYAEPQGKAEPYETASFRLDGVKECYDTARGIGVHGSKADIGRKAKGLSIWWVVPAAFVVCLSAVGIPWALGKAAGSYVSGKADIVTSATEVLHSGRKEDNAPEPVREAQGPVWVPGVTVRGVVTHRNRVAVTLSDGRVLTEAEPFLRVHRAFVEWQAVVGGPVQRFAYAKPEARVVPVAAAVVPVVSSGDAVPASSYVDERAFPVGAAVNVTKF